MSLNNSQLLTLIVGVGLTWLGFWKRNRRVKLIENGVKVAGEIVNIEERSSSGTNHNSLLYRPVIQYAVSDGKTITTSPDLFTNPCPYKVGDKVKVIFNPEDVYDFTLNDGPAVSVELITFWLGIAFLIAFAVLLLLKK